MNSESSRPVLPAVLLLLPGLAGIIAGCYLASLALTGDHALALAAFSVTAFGGGIFAIVLAFGLVMIRRWALALAVPACIVTGVIGSILAAVFGSVLPDIIENPRLALPLMAAAVVGTAGFFVILPGFVAYSLTREANLSRFTAGDASSGSTILTSVKVLIFALGLWIALFCLSAVVGVPFAVPGFGLGSPLSRILWIALAGFAAWGFMRIRLLDRKGWIVAAVVAGYLLIAWSSAIMAGGIDWPGAFSPEQQMVLARIRDPIERGALGLIFFSNAILLGLLYYVRERFS